jgi:integral membrane sensor domain MASE1
MRKKFLISVIAMFVMSMVLGFLLHGLWLAQLYAQLPGLFRQEQDAANYFPYMLLAHVLVAAGSPGSTSMASRISRSWVRACVTG